MEVDPDNDSEDDNNNDKDNDYIHNSVNVQAMVFTALLEV